VWDGLVTVTYTGERKKREIDERGRSSIRKAVISIGGKQRLCVKPAVRTFGRRASAKRESLVLLRQCDESGGEQLQGREKERERERQREGERKVRREWGQPSGTGEVGACRL